MKIQHFVGVLVCTLLSGCVIGHNFTEYVDENFVGEPKTIIAPAGSIGMLAVTKQVLREKGWKLIALRGPERIVGSLGENTDIRRYDEATARYILDVKWRELGTKSCNINFKRYASIHMTMAYEYSVSFIDWKTGVESLSVAGTGCLYDIVPELKKVVP